MHFANVGSIGIQTYDRDRLSISHLHLNRFEPHDLNIEVLPQDSPRYEQEIDLVPEKSSKVHDCSRGHCKKIGVCVSGQMFVTQLGTLNRYPNTLLGNPVKRRLYWDADRKIYCLHRHAPTFSSVLYYYQSGGRLYRPDDIPEDVFLQELEFYELGAEVLKEFKTKNGFLPEPTIDMPKYRWQKFIWMMVEYPSSSGMAKILGIISLLVILLSIANFCLETLPMFENQTCSIDNSSWVQVGDAEKPEETLNVTSPFFYIECFCAFWFTMEVILRLSSTPSWKTYFKSWINIFDIAAIVPFYVITGVVYVSGSCGDTKKSGTSIVFLRVLRLLRAFRILKLTKHSRGMQILGMTIKKSLQELYLFGLFLGITVVFFSAAVYYADMMDTDSENISSIPDGFWLTIITMCTVGYGDVTPKGLIGKLIGSVCVVSGVVTIALLVPVVVTNFSNYYSHELSGASNKRAGRQRLAMPLMCPTKH